MSISRPVSAMDFIGVKQEFIVFYARMSPGFSEYDHIWI